MKKVRAGNWYTFQPVGLDIWDSRTGLAPGARVQVRNVHGCPPANTMGHCYVFDSDGAFRGLVLTASLSRGVA